MRRQKPRRTLLIIPRKASRTVRRELYIIRRIGVDEIIRLKLKFLHIHITEFPLPEHRRVTRKIARVVDRFVSAERYVEITASVETTQTIEARAVEIVEQLCAFLRVCLAASNQPVEAIALPIEKLLVVSHSHAHPQTVLNVTVEVDQVWIDVIQEGLTGLQSKHDSEAPAKRLDVS